MAEYMHPGQERAGEQQPNVPDMPHQRISGGADWCDPALAHEREWFLEREDHRIRPQLEPRRRIPRPARTLTLPIGAPSSPTAST